MTDQETRLVPEGKRITNLTVQELDYASKRLGVNVMTALMLDDKKEPHPRQAMALAVVALCWARRTRPSAQLEEFTSLEFSELTALLYPKTDEPAPEINVDPSDPSVSPSG